jgi:hypothetical protein
MPGRTDTGNNNAIRYGQSDTTSRRTRSRMDFQVRLITFGIDSQVMRRPAVGNAGAWTPRSDPSPSTPEYRLTSRATFRPSVRVDERGIEIRP